MRKMPKKIVDIVKQVNDNLGDDYIIDVESFSEEENKYSAFITVTKRDAFELPDKFIVKHVKKEFTDKEEIVFSKDDDDTISIEINITDKINPEKFGNKISNVIFSIEGIKGMANENDKPIKVVIKKGKNNLVEKTLKINEATGKKDKLVYIEYTVPGYIKIGKEIMTMREYNKFKSIAKKTMKGLKELYMNTIDPNDKLTAYSLKYTLKEINDGLKKEADKYGLKEDNFSPVSKGEITGKYGTTNYGFILFDKKYLDKINSEEWSD